MSYQVLARKWRPKTFDEIVGQGTVTRTLKNALSSGRLGHAFLLSGARGVGKTTTARILAKALNCAQGEGPAPDPCGACPSCVEIAAGTSLDVQEIDGATHNGVEQVRELRESARYNPARDRFKVWIIDEVHMLSSGAFNALLKTLEEPPPRVKFIFATTEYHKLPDTILSRCQQYDFRLIPARELVTHLRAVADAEKVKVSDDALGRIARTAEGSARDALSLFDQVLSFSGDAVRDEDISALLGLIDRELLLAASAGIAAGDSLALFDLVERLADYGADYRNFVRELLLHFREILVVKLAPPGSALLAPIPAEDKDRLQQVAERYSEEDLLRTLDVLTKTETELRLAQDPRVTLELTLLKLVQMQRLLPFAELIERVDRMAAGLPAPARPAPAPLAAPRLPPPRPAPAATLAFVPPTAAAAAPPAPEPPTEPPPEPVAASGPDGLLARLREAAQTRPSLQQPLRSATVSMDGNTVVLHVSADFTAFAEMHADEYRELATKVNGRPTPVKIQAGAGAAPNADSGPTPEATPAAPPPPDKKEEMVREASREPAVQEALDLFGGRVVNVREARNKEGA